MYRLNGTATCRLIVMLCCLVIGHSAWAAPTLTDLSVQKLSPTTVDIILTFDQLIQSDSAIVHEHKHKLIIELPNTKHKLSKRKYSIQNATLKTLLIAQGEAQTQLIFDVLRVPFYTLHYKGNTLKIAVLRRLAGEKRDNKIAASVLIWALPLLAEIQADSAKAVDKMKRKFDLLADQATTEDEATQKVEPRIEPKYPVEIKEIIKETARKTKLTKQLKMKAKPVMVVRDIDFTREQLNGVMRIQMSGVDYNEPDISVEKQKLVLFFSGSYMNPTFRALNSIKNYATLVSNIDVQQEETGVRVKIETDRDYRFTQQKNGTEHVVVLKPLKVHQAKTQAPEIDRAAAAMPEKKKRRVFKGKKITLNFQDIDVRSVLQLIGDFSGQNIVASDSVDGRITLRLIQVPWSQALDVVLKTKGLSMRKNKGIILIAPAGELRQYEKIELEAGQQRIRLAPLASEYIPIYYANASDIAQFFKTQNNSLLSTRGSIVSDERTNSILLNDTPQKVAEIKRLLKKLDVPVKQVLIEAKIVVAKETFTQSLGIKFRSSNRGGVISAADPSSYDFNINFLGDSEVASLALAQLPSSRLLDLELQALESEGHGEVVSSPRLITANKHTATIESGEEISFDNLLESSASGDGITYKEFKKILLALEVTPQITPDRRIILDLSVSQDTLSPQSTGSNIAIDTQHVETQVLVNDGETVVLGGIYKESKNDTWSRMPFLSDLPILGKLFKSKVEKRDKTELIVFVTPTIIDSEPVKVAKK